MKVTIKIDIDTAKKKIEKKDNIFSMKKNIQNIELVYLPYYLFRSEISTKDKTIVQHICVDSLKGEHAFLQMKNLAGTEKSVEIEDKILSEAEALVIAKKEIKASLFLEKGKGLNLNEISISCEGVIKYPYWIGYFNRKSGVDFEVVDAVNGKKQGPKMKPVFIQLIMQ